MLSARVTWQVSLAGDFPQKAPLLPEEQAGAFKEPRCQIAVGLLAKSSPRNILLIGAPNNLHIKMLVGPQCAEEVLARVEIQSLLDRSETSVLVGWS